MDVAAREKAAKKESMLSDFPCLSEKKLVDNCYKETAYDKEACALPITNYKTCKKFWGSVEKIRKLNNVQPAKPDVEERKRIKAYFLEHKKLPKFPLEQTDP